MRLHRFYTTTTLDKNITVTDSAFIHQWKNVFRYGAGDSLVLFGGGCECEYKIMNMDKKSVELELISQKESLKRTSHLTLAISLIKKDNLELVLQKCTELGVGGFVLVQTDRSEKKGFNRGRLEKILIEATEQSGWGSVPTLSDVMKFSEVLSEYPGAVVLDGEAERAFLKEALSKNTVVCIGPEGGFSDAEVGVARASGARLLSLGSNTLRAETAAMAAASVALL